MRLEAEEVPEQGLTNSSDKLDFAALNEYVSLISAKNLDPDIRVKKISSVRFITEWAYEQKQITKAESLAITRKLDELSQTTDESNLLPTTPTDADVPKEESPDPQSSSKPSPQTLLERLRSSFAQPKTRKWGAFAFSMIAIGIAAAYLYEYSGLSGSEHQGDVAGAYLESAQQQQKGKILRFQGVLRDGQGSPISQSVPVDFALYDTEDAETPLYTGSCQGEDTVSPDEDGSFSIVIGESCGMKPIPNEVVETPDTLYLGISIAGNAEMKPRYALTTIAESQNARRIQGLAPGSGTSSIPYIDQEGRLQFDAVSPVITSSSGLFQITGQTMLLATQPGSGGSLYFEPDGSVVIPSSELGIGTDQPQAAIDVAGDSIFRNRLGLGTGQLIDDITLGGNVSPLENDKVSLGSATNRFQSVYTSQLILPKEGIGGYWQRKNNALIPVSDDETILLGSKSGSDATVRISSDRQQPAWFTNSAFGVGTDDPQYQFSALGNASSDYAISLANFAETDNSDTGVARMSLGTKGIRSTFIDFYTDADDETSGDLVGSIGMVDDSLTFQTSGADYAEYLKMQEDTQTGMIVSLSDNGGRPARSAEMVAGVVTNTPGVVGNAEYADNDSYALVGLLGQIETKVTTQNGIPQPGDQIMLSDLAGFGMVFDQNDQRSSTRTQTALVGTVVPDDQHQSSQQAASVFRQNDCPVSAQGITDRSGNPVACGTVTILVRPQMIYHELELPVSAAPSQSQKGKALIPQGLSSVTVPVPDLHDDHIVSATPVTSDPTVQIVVSELQPCQGSTSGSPSTDQTCTGSFTITAVAPVADDVQVHWHLQ